MIFLHSLYQNMRTICARVVDLGDDINAFPDLDEPEREAIGRLCFQARDLLDEAITQIEKVLQGAGYQVGTSSKIGEVLPGVLSRLLQGREPPQEANRKPEPSQRDSLDTDDNIPVSIPRFVARRLAILVRFTLISTKGLHPDHGAILLKALGDSTSVAEPAKGSNDDE